MRFFSLVTLVLSAGSLVSIPGLAFDGNNANAAPQMNTLSAKAAKPGDTLVITGVGLGANKIDEVYLTDHKFDMKVKVLEQKDTSIKIRVPPFAKPGRLQLMCLTKGADAALLEQPLYILIKDPSDKTAEKAEPAVQTVQMKVEDLPPPGAPIGIPIVGATTAPANNVVAPQASAAKKTEPVKAAANHDKQ